MDLLRPYLLLACVAFTIGFVGYWALGRLSLTSVSADEATTAPVSMPASSPDDWNPLKRI